MKEGSKKVRRKKAKRKRSDEEILPAYISGEKIPFDTRVEIKNAGRECTILDYTFTPTKDGKTGNSMIIDKRRIKPDD
jgi:hypothetical protein